MDRLKVIPLTQGFFTVVDEEDFEKYGHLKWFAKIGGTDGRPYAARSFKNGNSYGTMRLHREIMDAPPGHEVDHENCDTLDNRRGNLKIMTKEENCHKRWNNQ